MVPIASGYMSAAGASCPWQEHGLRRWTSLGIALLAFLGAGACTRDGTSAPNARPRATDPAATATTTAVADFAPDQADRLIATLSSRDPEQVEPVLASPLRADAAAIAAQAVPAGSQATPDPTTISKLGDGLASIDVTVMGPDGSSRYTLVVGAEDNRWVVVGTTRRDAGR